MKRNPPKCKLGPPASAGGLILTSPIAPFHCLQLWGGFAGLSRLRAAIPNPVGGEEIGSSVSFMLLPVKPSPEAGRELCNRRKETRGEKQKRLQGGQSGGDSRIWVREQQRKAKCPHAACPSSQGGDAELEGTGVPDFASFGDFFIASPLLQPRSVAQ